MTHIDIKIPHSIPQEEALRRIKNLLSNLQKEHSGIIKNVQENWSGHEGRFSFSAKGFLVSGKIYVGVDTVRVSSRLPFLLSFYKSAIIRTIEQKGAELLNNYEEIGNN